uniref:Uncharacterized protein n=1 Tax=viral metagenome TaxID=1070528 RepID=A0A6M3IPW6_9ZZZZ
MSDMSDLCPIFNTGVYSEITIPEVLLAAISTTGYARTGLKFSRSVSVTAAFVRCRTAVVSTTAAIVLKLAKAASKAATGTVFASLKLSKTNGASTLFFQAMTVTSKNFGPTDVLQVKTGAKETLARTVELIVRYKEK